MAAGASPLVYVPAHATQGQSFCNRETLVLSPKLFSYQVDDLGTANLEEREESKDYSFGIPCRKSAAPGPPWGTTAMAAGPISASYPGLWLCVHKPLIQQLSSWVSVENNSGSIR